MQSQIDFLKPVFLAVWACVAAFAIWETRVRESDSTAALAAGIVLLASLLLSRFVLQLPFKTAPMLYLALLGFVHLGAVVPWALGLYDLGRTPWLSPYGMSRALALITYSIVSYQLGLLVALRGREFRNKPFEDDSEELKGSRIFVAGSFLFFLGAIMFVVGLIQLDPTGYYHLTYSETFRLRAESDPRFFGTGITFAFIGLCMTAAGASRRQTRAAFCYAAIFFLVLFYLGFRSPAITAVLLVCAVSYKKGIKLPRLIPLVAAVALLVAVPLVRITREQPTNAQSLARSLLEINILDGPAEVGGAIRPLVETIDLVGPGTYRHGRTYLITMKGIVPNLAFHWEAAAPESIDDLPPNHWVTAIVDPWARQNHEGIGFSGVAEPYMNFGLAGVIIYFPLLAFLLVRLEQVSIQSSYVLASWALIVGPLLWTTRNDFTDFFRPAVWGLMCVGLVRLSSGGLNFISRDRRVGGIGGKARISDATRLEGI
jgi:oligosaccharide repeat unit polymerase